MDPVDQGTVVMFTLAFLFAGAATMWFTCNWYHKRLKKQRDEETKKLAKKQKVKQTFSRFSQVDEELTIQIDDGDEEILKAHKKHSIYDNAHLQVNLKKDLDSEQVATETATKTTTNTKSEHSEKAKINTGYLETDL